jgi:anaerobic selenocysteine-containing dehydrogenase
MSDRRYIAEPQSPPKQRADEQAIDYSPAVHDQVSTTTCYMCACRCGIKVHLQDGRIRYIEGNRDHLVNGRAGAGVPPGS